MIKTYFYDSEKDAMFHDVDLTAKDSLLSNPHNHLWIDVYDCSASELNYLGDVFDFHPLALEDCLQVSPRAKLDRYDDYNFFVFHALRYFEDAEEEDEISSIELDVFMGSNYLVTIHPVALAAVGKVARICLKETQLMNLGPEHLLYRIIDNIVDDYFPIISRLGERIDDLEDNIFLDRGREITEEILALKRTIILLRKVLIPQRRIFGNINGHYSFLVNEENVPYYLDLVDHLDSILDTANTYRDLVNSTTETYYSIINGRTSEIITVLTVISIIMMPLTVITGFFGMNVTIPGSANPYYIYFITAFMLVLSISMLGFFRYRRWI
ncbi:magnesium/cobalt transporter CorA [Syntrophomonas palmitatica]|uniref:magnesium/cobalt transporter CorA n=1 Tax=Syntrophomonas palmitatica TaxID=402877 RepID=UPI0006D066C3|nr:magnesium/cobalt transporter CorA [Syntrophomonas palmitatica]